MMQLSNIKKGDVFIFRNESGHYNALICTSYNQSTSPFYYSFAGTTIDQKKKPSIEEIRKAEFYGIGNRIADFYKYEDLEIKKMWKLHSEIEPYHLGTYDFTIWRKDFLKFKDELEMIGHLNIVENLDKNGNGGMNASSFELLVSLFSKEFEVILEQRGQKKYKMEAIIRD